MHIMHNINTYQHNMRFLIMPILTKKYASGDHRVTNDLSSLMVAYNGNIFESEESLEVLNTEN